MPGFLYTPVHFTFLAQPLGNATILPVTLARWVPMSAGATEAICIQCKKCGVCLFCTCDMMKHLKVVHANDAHLFHDDIPDLSGMQAQDILQELAEQMVEADKAVEEESSSD